MVKLWVLSDLHGEFQPDDRALVGPASVDAAIFAGDIHKVRNAIAYARSLVGELPLVLVGGNHEHYNSRLTVDAGNELLSVLAREEREKKRNLTFVLENSSVTVELCGELITFVGATLWTDFLLFRNYTQSEGIARELMNDFKAIMGARTPYRALHPSDTVAWHKQSRAFIKTVLSVKHAHKIVVITHHAPSLRSVAARYLQDGLTPAFSSDCDDLLELGADLWVHGHTHDSFDYIAGKTHVVCNPRGYPVSKGSCGFENRKFNPQLVIRI